MVYVPREMLDDALPRPTPLHGACPRNACAGLLGEHLAALLQGLPSATPQELPFLTRATVHLIAASLASSAQNQALARPAIDSVLLRRARKQVELQLMQDELSAGQLCLALKVSRSTLYRLFEPLGGVAQYIKEHRLARVHEILSQSAERHPAHRPSGLARALRGLAGQPALSVPAGSRGAAQSPLRPAR